MSFIEKKKIFSILIIFLFPLQFCISQIVKTDNRLIKDLKIKSLKVLAWNNYENGMESRLLEESFFDSLGFIMKHIEYDINYLKTYYYIYDKNHTLTEKKIDSKFYYLACTSNDILLKEKIKYDKYGKIKKRKNVYQDYLRILRMPIIVFGKHFDTRYRVIQKYKYSNDGLLEKISYSKTKKHYYQIVYEF